MSTSNVGVLVVAHGDLAAGLVSAAAEILGPSEGIKALRIDPGAEDPRQVVEAAIRELDRGAGVLALTDLFGGTPANIALALCPEYNLEVVTGASLPMLIRALSRRSNATLKELAADVAEYGRKQVLLPNQLLLEKATR